jgi:hypothetical protein
MSKISWISTFGNILNLEVLQTYYLNYWTCSPYKMKKKYESHVHFFSIDLPCNFRLWNRGEPRKLFLIVLASRARQTGDEGVPGVASGDPGGVGLGVVPEEEPPPDALLEGAERRLFIAAMTPPPPPEEDDADAGPGEGGQLLMRGTTFGEESGEGVGLKLPNMEPEPLGRLRLKKRVNIKTKHHFYHSFFSI